MFPLTTSGMKLTISRFMETQYKIFGGCQLEPKVIPYEQDGCL
jgi:hypothetical protein